MICDNSQLSAYCKCQLYHNLRYQRHLKPYAERPSANLGLAIHDFFDTYTSGRDIQPTIARWTEALEYAPLDRTPAETDNTLAQFYSACGELTKHYPMTIDPNGTKLILSPSRSPRWIVRYPEIPFIIPLSPSHSYTGRIDNIVEDGNQLLFVIELKTSASANSRIWRERWRMDTQPKGYVWTAERHTSKTIAGAIIIPVAILKGRAEVTPEIELRYTPEQLQQWYNDTITMMENIVDTTVNSSFLPTGRYCGNCSSISFGKCEFFNYCHSSYNEELLAQSTEINEWNPLEVKI